MAQLAILGHATRGREVIELLEMLGGKNKYDKIGSVCHEFYYIGHRNRICSLPISETYRSYVVFTLEEFLEKYPYKVGDKVLLYNEICIITRAAWDISRVLYKVNNNDYDIFVVEQLQPINNERNYTF